VVTTFRIRGSLRFLSHAETLRVFQRACVRAGVKIQHSQGFNPRPRISLPLPRPVGVETDDDLLCIRLHASRASFDPERFKGMLSGQLPQGVELLEVTLAEPETSFQPCRATYVWPVRSNDRATDEPARNELVGRIEYLLATDSLNRQRRTEPRSSKFKNVDVRPFLKSIEFDGTHVRVECNISPAGSIRLDELLDLLELDQAELAAPVRRTAIRYLDT
jgi:radical SAM-linked protein